VEIMDIVCDERVDNFSVFTKEQNSDILKYCKSE
jgi:hypothetical protein